MPDVIAIVGRPNVGKSALFNRIVGKRIAIVHDMPGVTRDRVTAESEWRGRVFTLVDTGGIGLVRGEHSPDVLTTAAINQVDLAIELAQVILFVVNVQEGLTPLDSEVAARLRKADRPVLLVVNKVDNYGVADHAVEFSRLGFDSWLPVSAIHGVGIQEMLDAAVKRLPPKPAMDIPEENQLEAESEPADENAADGSEAKKDILPPPGPLRLAIVGRPNVGKSSLVNALTRSERVIVSPIPGTTRDAIDVPFEVVTEGRVEQYVLTDTAGIRKNKHAQDTIEFFSVQRSEQAIERCDLAVLVLDAGEGVTEQDKRIAGLIVEHRKACVVVVNKWDLAAESVAKAREKAEELRQRGTRGERKILTTLGEFGEWVQEKLFFIDYAPVIFTSATEGYHLDRLLESVRYVADQLRQRVPTALLNRTLNDAVEKRQPVSSAGHRLKFFYATQVKASPPIFLLFVNRSELFSDPYSKYLGGELRKAFGYEGCPIILIPKARPKTIEPVRRHKARPNQSARPVSGAKPSKKPNRWEPRKGRPNSRKRPSDARKRR